MSQSNLSATLVSKGNLQLKQRPLPKPGPLDVLVSIRSVGICGSDIHYWENGRVGDFIVEYPLVLGHESAGVVFEIGSHVTDLQPGDRVAIEPGVPCRRCITCKSGRYNLCGSMRFLATPPIDGALTEYISHPADFCYPLPDNVSLDEGAMLEPLSVGVHACRRGNITPGSNVLVMGSGPVGLACLLAAQAMGAGEIVVTDINQERLNVADSLGATTFHADSKTLSEDIRDELDQIDLSIDCSGAETAVKTAIDVTVPGGTIVIVGLGSDEMTLPIIRATTREIDIRGIFRYVNAYPTALEMVSSGKVSIDTIISHHFELQDVADAFTTARNAAQGVMKVMVTI